MDRGTIKMDINEIMDNVITEKYESLSRNLDMNDRFIKITHFEGNAIGQIGETFVKNVFKTYNIPMKDIGKDIIHDEYDIISNNKKIEIKTARKGFRDGFQFNGINPIYNHDYIILIGLSTKQIYYKIISGASIYDHKTRSRFLTVKDKPRKLVSMNPGNTVNYKLTLRTKDLDNIETFVDELKKIFVDT